MKLLIVFIFGILLIQSDAGVVVTKLTKVLCDIRTFGSIRKCYPIRVPDLTNNENYVGNRVSPTTEYNLVINKATTPRYSPQVTAGMV